MVTQVKLRIGYHFPLAFVQLGQEDFVEAAKTKMFNVLSTTCGMLDHDIARAYKHYYHGDFELDDIELGEHQLMRLGNVIVPNASYGEIIRSCCNACPRGNPERSDKRNRQRGC